MYPMVFCFLFSTQIFLIVKGYFLTIFSINRQKTNLEVVLDTD